jgi:hypothetical protein
VAADLVKLEILDATGAVLRSFESGQRLRPFPLSSGAGHHRFRWDFTLPGPEGTAGAGAGGDEGGGAGRRERGPMVAPGAYQVRLTAGSWTATRPFRVLIDPRLPPDGVTEEVLRAQVAMSLKARDLVSESRRLVARLAEVRRRAAGVESEGARRAMPRLAALEARVVTAQGRYPTPMLADQIAFLYTMTLTADQQLGRDVYERYDELAGLLARAKAELEGIVSAELPSLEERR